jgi:hypothetical protein
MLRRTGCAAFSSDRVDSEFDEDNPQLSTEELRLGYMYKDREVTLAIASLFGNVFKRPGDIHNWRMAK